MNAKRKKSIRDKILDTIRDTSFTLMSGITMLCIISALIIYSYLDMGNEAISDVLYLILFIVVIFMWGYGAGREQQRISDAKKNFRDREGE